MRFDRKNVLFCFHNFSQQALLPSPPRVSAVSLEAVVQNFNKTAPTKRKIAAGITEGPDMKRRKMKSQERDSSSPGEENLHKNNLDIFINSSDLEDSSDSEVEITSTSPPVVNVTTDSSEDSSGETDSEEEKLRDDGEKVALVIGYLQKVTPEIARELQVRLMRN